MRTRVQKWGNSLALRIPDISLADGELVIRPLAAPKVTLKQLLAKVTKENLHREVDTGFAVGNETW